jgi:hypothetical protein
MGREIDPYPYLNRAKPVGIRVPVVISRCTTFSSCTYEYREGDAAIVVVFIHDNHDIAILI